METDILIDQLINQALSQSIKETFKPVKASPIPAKVQVSDIPLIETSVDLSSQPDLSQTDSNSYLPVNQQPRKRISKEEREKLGIEEYQKQKDEANRDLILKGLLGAGVIAGIGLLGRKQIQRGTDLARQYSDTVEKHTTAQGGEYLKPRPSFFDPRFWAGTIKDKTLKQEHQGRLKEIYSNPLKLAGAAAYRLGIDGATDATRSYGWRYNHPLSILSDGIKHTIDPMDSLGVVDRHGVYFAAAMPALAVGGLAYDIANPSELFRPPGFKQPNPNPDNPKESTDPAVDLFQRFALGRSGRPLKYSEAKKDIPDLNFERYKDYLRFTYQDKGPLGLGLIKYTDENLQGQPELRMLGYPINIPTITTAALGALGARLATTNMEKQYRSDMSKQVTDLMDIKPARAPGFVSYKEPIRPDGSGGGRVVTESNELPNVLDPKVIREYVGKKPGSVQRRQLIGALGGVAAGVTAGAFLGTYINNAIASSKNNPENLPNTKEYGIS